MAKMDNNLKVFVFSEEEVKEKQKVKNFIRNIYGDKNVQKVYIDYDRLTEVFKDFEEKSEAHKAVINELQELSKVDNDIVVKYYSLKKPELDIEKAFSDLQVFIYTKLENIDLVLENDLICQEINKYKFAETYTKGTQAYNLKEALIENVEKREHAVEI